MILRIKICGLTREADVDAAVDAGADAIGFVFYEKSPRYVSLLRAEKLCQRLPPLVASVGLFVNAGISTIAQHCRALPLQYLQLHGDEAPAFCRQLRAELPLPQIKALRVSPALNLSLAAKDFSEAGALVLLDADSTGFGGAGQCFDWSLVPENFQSGRFILSGGLNAENVGDAIARLRPQAVDVSSGVETDKGIKDVKKIENFVGAARRASEKLEATRGRL